MSEVKRYDPMGYDRLSGYMQQHPEGDYVRHADYAALEAECERLADELDRKSVITGDYIARCQRLAAERDHLKACQENAQLHITGLVAERNAALWQLYKLSGLLRDVESAYTTAIHWEDMQKAMGQIDAALAEIKP